MAINKKKPKSEEREMTLQLVDIYLSCKYMLNQ